MHLTLYCDGAARGNPGPAAFGYIVKDQAGALVLKGNGFLGVKTNNEAEYQAVIEGLSGILNYSDETVKNDWLIDVRMDSQLVNEQLNGHFKIKNSRMRDLLVRVRELEGGLGSVSYHWIPRHENKEADYLANQALDERG